MFHFLCLDWLRWFFFILFGRGVHVKERGSEEGRIPMVRIQKEKIKLGFVMNCVVQDTNQARYTLMFNSQGELMLEIAEAINCGLKTRKQDEGVLWEQRMANRHIGWSQGDYINSSACAHPEREPLRPACNRYSHVTVRAGAELASRLEEYSESRYTAEVSGTEARDRHRTRPGRLGGRTDGQPSVPSLRCGSAQPPVPSPDGGQMDRRLQHSVTSPDVGNKAASAT
ncbi:hypothetical protein B0H14DRAFT_2564900 [Mycena olivaceomarginata]|nr:hypothetical protein B0H14DRAFT_2564900 [Mycena olivaceomarginata]